MTDARTNPDMERRRTPKRRALQRSILEATQGLLETVDAADLSMDQVAQEAGVAIEMVNEYYHSKNELLVATAANELTGVARQMFSGHKNDPGIGAASSDALGLLRSAKMILGPSVEPEIAAARDGAAIEHANSDNEVLVPLPDSDVAALVTRVSILEKRHTEAVTGLRKATGVLATQAQQQGVVDDKAEALVAEAQQLSIYVVTETLSEPESQGGAYDMPGDGNTAGELIVRSTDAPHEGFLVAARRAAKVAAAHHNSLHEKDSKYVKAGRRAYLSIFGSRDGDRKRRGILGVGTAAFAGVVAAVSFVMPEVEQSPAPAQSAMVAPAPERPTQLAINAPEMAQLLERATAGNFDAETLLGLRYLNGDGVAKDEGEAFYWFERGAKNGQPLAQYWLATLLARPGGAYSDPAQAIKWYEEAAKRGNRKAMNDLAVSYAQGDGTELDMRQAAYWFGQAAKFGDAEAQFNLAVLYERGEGVERNITDAYKWYAVVARSGDREAAMRVVVLSRSIDAASLRAAQATADAFTPEPIFPPANTEPKLPERGTG